MTGSHPTTPRLRLTAVAVAVCALFVAWQDQARAAKIITMASEPAAMNIQYNGTTLSSVGPQSTPVQFGGFLSQLPAISPPPASFTFGGITRSGSTFVNGTSVVQQFTGGTLSLYDSTQTLLLSANLSGSALNGSLGRPDGALFTTLFSSVTGGTLAANIDGPTLVFQMHLSNINGGSGFSTAPPSGSLQSFTANVTASLDAGQVPIPEPATIALLAIFATLGLARRALR
jgi:hypothetical protein